MTAERNSSWTREDVGRKLRGLIALAKNNPDEGEIAAAMAAVHRLLAKYNMSMSDIELSAELGSVSRQIEFVGVLHHWLPYLAEAVKLITDTRVLFYRSRELGGECAVFVGAGTDVLCAMSLWRYLVASVTNMARGRSAAGSYSMGVAVRIRDRAEKLSWTSAAMVMAPSGGAHSGMPIELLKRDAISRYLQHHNVEPKITTTRADIRDAAAYSQGYADGATVPLCTDKALQEGAV